MLSEPLDQPVLLDLSDRLVTKVFQVLPDQPVLWEDLLALLDQLAALVQLEPQVLKEYKDQQERQVRQVLQEVSVQLDLPARKET
jgi:hypothetical protein